MELARDKNCAQAWNPNRRCTGITGARVESRGALAWNGRVPSRAARDAGFFKRATDFCPRITDAACCGTLQQTRANRASRRLVPHDVLKVGFAMGRATTPWAPYFRRAGDCLPYL